MKSEPFRTRAAPLETLESRVLFAAAMLKDIAPGPPYGGDVRDFAFVRAAGAIYFGGLSNPDTGAELWKSDGTPEGTMPFADLVPGPTGSWARPVAELDGKLVFSTIEPAAPYATRLWTTDGTPESVTPFGAETGPLFQVVDTLAVGRRLYVSTYNADTNSAALWTVEGAGGAAVKLFEYRLLGQYEDGVLMQLANVGDTVYFSARSDDPYQYLWKTDGTPAGTVRLARVDNGPVTDDDGDTLSVAPRQFTAAGDHLFFLSDNALWQSDGTPAGTGRIASVPGVALFAGEAGGDSVFVSTLDRGEDASGLWKTDGTEAGTTRVATFSRNSNPAGFVRAGDVTYFSSWTQVPNLWRTDGTPEGTRPLLDSTGAQVLGGIGEKAVYQGSLYFAGYRDGEGAELWRTDGSPSGTTLVQDLTPAPDEGGSFPHYFATFDDALYFLATTPGYGTNPWRYVKDPVPPPVVVSGRHVFYNNSVYDGRDPAATLADVSAVATDKSALLPGQAASFANVTTYARGLDGLLVDFAGVPAQLLGAADFEVATSSEPDDFGWAAGPTPTVTLLPNPTGANVARYALTWPDGAVRNAWLRVTVKSGDRTGLASPDVFSFGNLIGDGGDGATNLRVNALDLTAVRRALNTPSPIDGRVDFNRDGLVNALDLAAVRGNLGHALPLPTSTPAAGLPALTRRRDNSLLA